MNHTMKVTRKEDSSLGTLFFCGEDFFYLRLKDIPRNERAFELLNKLINEKKINEKERKIVLKSSLEAAPILESSDLLIYFFNPRPKDDRGSMLSEILSLYEGNILKGDPLSTIYLNLLDEDSSFVKKYPHMTIFEDIYYLSFKFSETETIKGLNITSSTFRKTSGYFPQEFWFCGIDKSSI